MLMTMDLYERLSTQLALHHHSRDACVLAPVFGVLVIGTGLYFNRAKLVIYLLGGEMFGLVAIQAFLIPFVTVCVPLNLSIWYMEVHKLSRVEALVFSTPLVLSSAVTAAASRFVFQSQRWSWSIIAPTIMAASSLLIRFVKPSTAFNLVLALQIMYGVGAGDSWQAPYLIMRDELGSESALRSRAFSLLRALQVLGAAMGVVAGREIFAHANDPGVVIRAVSYAGTCAGALCSGAAFVILCVRSIQGLTSYGLWVYKLD